MALSLVLLSVPSGPAEAGVQAMVADYLKRTSRYMPAQERLCRSQAALLDDLAGMRREGAAEAWLADPGGKAFSSEGFASQIRTRRDGGIRRLAIAIGPADGWTDDARTRADLLFSLGPMTLPHQLARLVVAEQIYRAATILAGHPYHLGH